MSTGSNLRVAVGSNAPLRRDGSCVLYWMQRAQRGAANPALNHAITLANELGLPVAVLFALTPSYPGAQERHYAFMLQGLAETAATVAERGCAFVVRLDEPDRAALRLARELKPACVVADENPLRVGQAWRNRIREGLDVRMDIVDADVVVPSAHFPREEWSAATLRRKLTPVLYQYLTPEPEAVPQVRWSAPPPPGEDVLSWEALLRRLPVSRDVLPVPGAVGGRAAGLRCLEIFVRERLIRYAEQRNRPELEATSRLSAYLHFGQIGPIEAALAARKMGGEGAESFVEELVVRRELAVNFVARNPRYDTLEGCPEWARKTLEKHAGDPREVLSLEELEQARSPDPLWNAAQRQMVQSGYMAGYMRMLWAKRILEWSPTPEEAFRRAVWLNDRYQLDGRDPNGYNGVAWSIGGKHDRPWGPERPIFGLIRYMSSAAAYRKFDAVAYIRRWGGGQPSLPLD